MNLQGIRNFGFGLFGLGAVAVSLGPLNVDLLNREAVIGYLRRQRPEATSSSSSGPWCPTGSTR